MEGPAMIRAAILALAILVAGCANLAAPQSFEQRIAYAHGTVTATLQSCEQLYRRGRISAEQGRHCLALTDRAAAALEIARGSTEPQSAEHWLQLATQLLAQLETMLAEAQQR
jgi:hypothetical protein